MNTLQDLQTHVMSLYNKLLNRRMMLDEIMNYQTEIASFMNAIASGNTAGASKSGLHAALMLCLDQYTFSENGDVIVPDRIYDIVHQLYMQLGGKQIIYPDHFESRWKMATHKRSELVGSVRKVYSIKELLKYINDIYVRGGCDDPSDISWIISPKYDGISACLEFKNKKLIQALTRGDNEDGGRIGQDITEMVRYISNMDALAEKYEDGFLKVELLCPTSGYEYLKSEYKNRRSATTAIVNTPKNIEYARFLYAMPLMYEDRSGHLSYHPKYSIMIEDSYDIRELIYNVEDLMAKIRSKDFPYRVDGVILYPCIHTENTTTDVMAEAMAYKINTAENRTKIERGYVSIGRAGKATPMIQVTPCEVNETTVTDASIGSFQKFKAMGLREGETVIVYSAGDVIPQVKRCDPPEYPEGAPYLDIPERCPYCNAKLSKSYYCENPNCSRVITGAITNFLVKMGADNMADGTIEALRKEGLIHNLLDVFKLTERKISTIEGFGDKSAERIIDSIHLIQNTPTSYSKFFGALGVPNASTKTFEKIFSKVDPSEFLEELEKMYKDNINPSKTDGVYRVMIDIPGINATKRKTIMDYLFKNWEEIRSLLKFLNLQNDKPCKGEVVFTGFRDKSMAQRFENLGFKIGESVNKNTTCVIAADMNTTKVQNAVKKNIPIFLIHEVDTAIEYCISL